MRHAIIDIGTNTINLLIAENSGDKIIVIHQDKKPVKLGEGGLLEKKIQDEAFYRGVEAMAEFSQLIKHHRCEKITALATAAVRNAQNGNDFVNTVHAKTGILIAVIDGNREAELITTGARHAVKWNNTGMIMDIGGGSTEFILANQSINHYVTSTPLGVSRLKEMFSFSDPVTPGEIELLRNYIIPFLSELQPHVVAHTCDTLIGCAGSFDSLADILYLKKEGRPFDFKKNTGAILPLDEVMQVLESIINSTAYQRAVMPGLPVFRQPYMVYAAILIKEVIEFFGIKNVYLSAYALKEGAFYESVQE